MFNNEIISLLQCSGSVTNPAWFLSLSIMLALMPLAVCMLTSFVKLSIVLGVLKNALGTQHAPGAMVTMVLSLTLTMLIMQPVVKQSMMHAESVNLEHLMKQSDLKIIEMYSNLIIPWKDFLIKNTGKQEKIALTTAIKSANETTEENSLMLLLPAFLLSELKEGFCMAFLLLVPFLVIDLIVANVLMGLGMMMLSPVVIALPIKLILFVVSDAWLLISQALIKSYN